MMQRCLIIEASPIIRRVSRAILADFGFEVFDTASGRDGLALFRLHAPGLVIVDASIADMPAIDVLRQIKSQKVGHVKTLYCTTDFDLVELQRVHAAGATDVLVKPFDRNSLAAKLDAGENGGKGDSRQGFYARLSRSELVRIT